MDYRSAYIPAWDFSVDGGAGTTMFVLDFGAPEVLHSVTFAFAFSEAMAGLISESLYPVCEIDLFADGNWVAIPGTITTGSSGVSAASLYTAALFNSREIAALGTDYLASVSFLLAPDISGRSAHGDFPVVARRVRLSIGGDAGTPGAGALSNVSLVARIN